MELDAGHAIAEIDQRCAGVFLDHAVGFLGDRNRPHAGGNLNRLPVAGCQLPVLATRDGFGLVRVPGPFPGNEQLLDISRDWSVFFLHASNRSFDASRIPELERSKFPVEAEAHGAVDFNDPIRNLGHAVGGVSPQIGESRPQECARLVAFLGAAFKAEQRAQACARILDVFGHVERGELWLSPGMVLEDLPVESHALVFLAFFTFHFLIEATLSFVAQPFALKHLSEEVRQAQVAAFIVHIRSHVANHVP